MHIKVTQMTNEVLLRRLLDAIPSYVFLVDRDMVILDYNAAAGTYLGVGPKMLRRRAGEVLHCLHARDAGCGYGPFCKDCLVRGAVNEAFAGKKCVRRQVRMELESRKGVKCLDVLVTASAFDYQGHERAVLVLEDISDLASARRKLPSARI